MIRGEVTMLDDELKKYLLERFKVEEKIPQRRANIIGMAENMVEAFDAMPVEQPGISIPPQPFEQLREPLADLKEAVKKASRERAESKAATALRKEMRQKGNLILRKIFLRAVSIWGVDWPNLFVLGMLPKSSIWTKGKPPPEDMSVPH